MNARVVVIVGLVGILVLVGLILFSTQAKKQVTPPTQTISKTPSKTPSSTPQPEVLQFDLDQQSNSGVTGIAKVQEMNGKVTITVDLMNDKSTLSHPSHFHTGTCSKPGPIKYALTEVKDAASTTELSFDMVIFKQNLPLILNVHRSAAQISSYIACGESSASGESISPSGPTDD